MRKLTGQCLCESISFQAVGEIKRISACYCKMCRVQNGGGAFYGVELEGQLVIPDETHLAWFDASRKARRGFCRNCGSTLFWQSHDNPDFFDVSLGALDDISGLGLDAHIFVDCAADYQTVPHTAPHFSEADVLLNPLAGPAS